MSVVKRQKVEDDMKKFEVCFEQLAAFKQFIDVVSNVLARVFLQLSKDSKGNIVLSLDTIDPTQVCIVQARLPCNGCLNEENISFCLDTSTLGKCLHNIPAHHSVKLSANRGSADVMLRSYDAMSNVEDIEFELHTFDDVNEAVNLEDLQYEYQTDVDMPSLKRIVKLATGLKCETIKLSTYTDTNDKGDVVTSVTQFMGDGDALFRRAFKSSIIEHKSGEGSTNAMETTENSEEIDISNMKLQFSSTFSLDYLNKFVKSMEHQLINIKFQKSAPMLLHYPLGVPESFVRFVLAPKDSEDDGN